MAERPINKSYCRKKCIVYVVFYCLCDTDYGYFFVRCTWLCRLGRTKLVLKRRTRPKKIVNWTWSTGY